MDRGARAERPRAVHAAVTRPGAGAERAFTLLEVMLAIVLTGLVVLLAYGAAQVSFDARARLSADLRALQEGRAVREVLQDALRNAHLPLRPGDQGFVLQGDRLSFVATGSGPPFDPEYDWLITIGPGPDGLDVVGTPIGRAPAAQVAFHVPGVTRWDVRVVALGGSQWLQTWRSATVMPRAVAITFWHGAAAVGLPLHVVLSPGNPLFSEEEEP